MLVDLCTEDCGNAPLNLNAALHGKAPATGESMPPESMSMPCRWNRYAASPLVGLRAEHDAAGLDVYAHKDVRLLHLDRNARKSIQHGCPQFGIHEGCVMLVVRWSGAWLS